MEHGATRNFQAEKLLEEEEKRMQKEREEEELNNPMKVRERALLCRRQTSLLPSLAFPCKAGDFVAVGLVLQAPEVLLCSGQAGANSLPSGGFPLAVSCSSFSCPKTRMMMMLVLPVPYWMGRWCWRLLAGSVTSRKPGFPLVTQVLENRTKDSKLEMEVLENLQELKELNQRQANVDFEAMLKQYKEYEEEQKRKEQEEDEQEMK